MQTSDDDQRTGVDLLLRLTAYNLAAVGGVRRATGIAVACAQIVMGDAGLVFRRQETRIAALSLSPARQQGATCFSHTDNAELIGLTFCSVDICMVR